MGYEYQHSDTEQVVLRKLLQWYTQDESDDSPYRWQQRDLWNRMLSKLVGFITKDGPVQFRVQHQDSDVLLLRKWLGFLRQGSPECFCVSEEVPLWRSILAEVKTE